jgi:UDP-N-acetylmuramoyl-L-alanyl-D-glutamate--2,6-diaminopimelate ligase
LGGAGGGRDKWKRPAMGAIAARYCDEIILTNEDPYNEDPLEILDEIASGIREADPEKAKRVYHIIDRKEAARKAFALAQPGDVIIGTGKGSEDWIHAAGGAKMPWNERKLFEEIMREKSNKAL